MNAIPGQAALPLTVSRFPTAFPTGLAFGTTESTTWSAFADLLQHRREGEKDGPCFIPAIFTPEPDGRVRRVKANLAARTAIVLDIDGNKETGEVPPSIAEVVAKIEAMGWAGAVYSSHNHTAAAPRYRIVLPLSGKIAPPLPAPEVIAGWMDLSGVLDATKLGAASAFYLPSSAPDRGAHHETVVIDGEPIDADLVTERAGAFLAEREAEQARQRDVALEAAVRRRQERAQRGFDPNASIIESVRDRMDLQGELIRHGYKPMGGNRFLYPGSETGVPGVHILTGSDGVDRVYSHHAADPLAAGNLPSWCRAKAIDAVDVVTILDHGCDLKAALRTLAGRFGIEASRPVATTPEPPPHPGYDGPEDAPDPHQPAPEQANDEDSRAALRALLSVDAWAERDIPEPDRLLGDLLTTTTRVFLVGRTGLGKTLLGLAIAAGVASGAGFLQWVSGRPARVLYLDGEMPAELIKPRARDAIRRLGGASIPPGNLLIFGRDIEAEARRVCPDLPPFAPLNTEGGRKFLIELLDAIGGVDLLICDNVMSLISGDQKDELPWSETLPLVAALTDRRVGQLWLDHTGHNSDRQYGSSTKAWRFDAVGCMTPLADGQNDPRSTAFQLSFDHPGKARRRTPDNWREFEAQIIRLQDDMWTAEPVEQTQSGRQADQLRPGAIAQHKALLDALAVSSTPGKTTRDAWYAECVRLGLAQAIPSGGKWADRDRVQKTFRTYLSQLKVAGWIGVDGETVADLKGGR